MNATAISLDGVLGEGLVGVTFDSVLVVDDQSWRVVACNDNAVDLYGAPLVGVALETMFNVDDIIGVERLLWAAQNNLEPLELQMERVDGDGRTVLARARRSEVAGCSVRLLVLQDVTARRRLEQRLATIETEQKALLDTLEIGVLALDAAGKILSANRFAPLQATFGDSLVGRNFFLDVAPGAETRPAFQRFQEWAHDPGREPYSDRFEFDVGRRLIEAELHVGTPIGAGIAAVRLADATVRREAEERLRNQTFQAEEAARHAGLVYQTVSLIHQSLDLAAVLQTAVAETGRLLGACRCGIVEISGAGMGEVTREYARPELPSLVGLQTAFTDNAVVAEVARTLQIMVADEVDAHPIARESSLLAAAGAMSAVLAPIAVQRSVRGVLVVLQCDRARTWSQPELDLVTSIANQVGLATTQAEIHERLRRQAERDAAISRIAAVLHSTNDLGAALEAAIGEVFATLGGERCLLRELDEPARRQWCWHRTDDGHVARHGDFGDLAQVADAAAPDAARQPTARIESTIAGETVVAPFSSRRRGEVGGVLVLTRPAGDPWPLETLAFVNSVAVHVGVALAAAALIEAVISAKQMWEGTFDSMSDGIVIHDENLRIVRVNRAFARLSRTVPERLVGSDFLEVLSAENHRAVRRAAERVASTRRPVTFDIDEPSFGGTVSVSLSLLRLAEGTYYIHTLRDITEQRQMQERLAQASKMASIGHLAAGVAHEINTPLATITGCAQSLSRQLAATPELHQGGRWDAIAERLSTIVDQSFRCKKITRDLLDFAKPTKPVLRLTDLEVLLRETVEGIPYDAKATRVRFSTIGTAVPVMTDSDLLRQVVLNLVVNALDAVEGRMGAVINIEVRYLKRRVRIGVRDSGGGIAADDIDRIFDPFFTTKAPGKGTGLGLSISQSITQSLGGRLDASSVKGKGATFVVELPLDAVEARVRGARNRRTP